MTTDLAMHTPKCSWVPAFAGTTPIYSAETPAFWMIGTHLSISDLR
jgi:hypothetical protein